MHDTAPKGQNGQADRGEGGKNRYRMRQNLFSIGDDYSIENDRGEPVFLVDGKALRLSKTLLFEDRTGKELCKIQQRMISVRKTAEIEGPDGRPMATVRKGMFRLLREHFSVQLAGGPEIEIQGNLVDHEYEFVQGGRKIAQTSKKWFRVSDSYGVEIEPGQNDILILAVTVALDMLAHSTR